MDCWLLFLQDKCKNFLSKTSVKNLCTGKSPSKLLSSKKVTSLRLKAAKKCKQQYSAIVTA